MPHDVDFSTLIDLFKRLVQSQQGKKINPGDEWLNDAQILATKLFRHLVSMKIVADGATVDFNGVSKVIFVDHATVKVIARAALETYLVFFFLFGNEDSSLSKFRHKIWHLGGLTDRQRFHPITQNGRDVLVSEKAIIEKLRAEIRSSPHFLAYKEKERKNLIDGNWRIGLSWLDLGIAAGLHEKYFKNVYGYLCGYSHSSYLSALQVGQAVSIESQQKLARSIVGVGLVLMAHFAFTYSTLFEGAKIVLDANQPAKFIAEKWRFGREDLATIYDR